MGRADNLVDIVFSHQLISRSQLKFVYDARTWRVYIQNLSKKVNIHLERSGSELGFMDIAIIVVGERISFPTVEKDVGFRVDINYRLEEIDHRTGKEQFSLQMKPDLLSLT